jgi:hypothetical protein
MKNKNIHINFETSFENQIEILPRLTFIYGRLQDYVIAFEWLWFSVYICIIRISYDT